MANERNDQHPEIHPETHMGWSWFESGPDAGESGDDAGPSRRDLPDAGRELRLAYARCFAGPEGEKVLAHLRALTLERALGPDASDPMLRHLEGQRQLVTYILAQFERGRRGG